MAREFCGYFDSTVTDERVYQADEFAEAFRVSGGTGVGRGLAVLPAGGMRVAVSPGSAMIHGYTYALADDGGEQQSFVLAASGSADRIDRVALRLDQSANARSITMRVLEGTPGPSPTPPALTQTSLMKEISLCQIRVRAAIGVITEEDILDERGDAEVCGLPVPKALQPAVLDARYDGRYAGKGALDELSAGVLRKADVVNRLDETEQGKPLDAVQGNLLAQRIMAVEAGKAEVRSFTATLPAEGWSASAPHTQTVAVEGLTEAMAPLADVSLSDVADTARLELEAWGMVGKLVSGEGQLMATCYEDRPETQLAVRLISIQ